MSEPEKIDILTEDEVAASFIATGDMSIVSCLICVSLVAYNYRRDHILKKHGGMPFERFP